jgi:hypothetical protein
MNELFQFTVTDTFLIEGRGLILSPFFPVDQFHFDSKENVRIDTPDGRSFEAEAQRKQGQIVSFIKAGVFGPGSGRLEMINENALLFTAYVASGKIRF